jgi:hypothetical protein
VMFHLVENKVLTLLAGFEKLALHTEHKEIK